MIHDAIEVDYSDLGNYQINKVDQLNDCMLAPPLFFFMLTTYVTRPVLTKYVPEYISWTTPSNSIYLGFY